MRLPSALRTFVALLTDRWTAAPKAWGVEVGTGGSDFERLTSERSVGTITVRFGEEDRQLRIATHPVRGPHTSDRTFDAYVFCSPSEAPVAARAIFQAWDPNAVPDEVLGKWQVEPLLITPIQGDLYREPGIELHLHNPTVASAQRLFSTLKSLATTPLRSPPSPP